MTIDPNSSVEELDGEDLAFIGTLHTALTDLQGKPSAKTASVGPGFSGGWASRLVGRVDLPTPHSVVEWGNRSAVINATRPFMR